MELRTYRLVAAPIMSRDRRPLKQALTRLFDGVELEAVAGKTIIHVDSDHMPGTVEEYVNRVMFDLKLPAAIIERD